MKTTTISKKAQKLGKTDDIVRRQKEFLFPCVANYYEKPLVLVEGKGTHVKDADGNSLLDFFGGILTVSIGHANERINSAVKAQMDKLGHVSTLYPTGPIVDLAEMLAKIAPGRLQQSFFTNSGTEADETAFMLAQLYTGRQEVIALRYGYSGRTMLSQALTAHSTWRALPTQVAAVKHAVSPYCYRCPFQLKYPSCDIACARDIEELIQTTTTGKIAGFLAEPIQGVAGFIVPPKEYFKVAVEIVRKHGGVFICDEVQTAFGRTGGKMFGVEHFGVEPEIMTMAKGIANGMPMGATMATPEIADSIKALSISTFGGNPICCTAACETLQIVLDENLPAKVEKLGRRLRKGLEALKQKYPQTIGDVRGMGLMQAMELVVDETKRDRTPNAKATLQFFEETRKRGLLVGKGGLHGNIVRLAPPMLVTEKEIDEALGIIGESFAVMKT
jgi:alanine-glyoxylate transaminase/(R)-3-amino-2-methylpropionate-pyruvate transaminase